MNWERATLKYSLCGYCGGVIKRGDPMLVVTQFRRARCVDCASVKWHTTPPADLEPLPDEAAPLVVPVSRPRQPLTFRTPSAWARDFKVAQSGKD